MVIVGYQWLPLVISGYSWLSVVIVISGYRCLSALSLVIVGYPIGYQWLSVVIVGYRWLSLVIVGYRSGYRWVIGGCNWSSYPPRLSVVISLSLVIIGYRRYSVPELNDAELNALRYTAGYVPWKLKQKFSQRKDPYCKEYLTCLDGMRESSVSLIRMLTVNVFHTWSTQIGGYNL